ncbi:RNA helicase [Malassezia yamatoensis]|uniref:RNA helicase n=1 Tax=Malassezia yamatoensis TaxID=253288 RepID=A0AAJ6CGS0_9BASI|nr:RNA helicase [Malassezia yamatoensis]
MESNVGSDPTRKLTDAEEKKRTRKQRLEEWRKQQEAKKRAAESEGTNARKKPRQQEPSQAPKLGLRAPANRAVPKRPAAVFMDNDDEDEVEKPKVAWHPNAAETSSNTNSAVPRKEEEDEIDPLDAYMTSVQTEVDEVEKGTIPKEVRELVSDDEQNDGPITERRHDEDDDKEDFNADALLAMTSKRPKQNFIPRVDHSKMDYEPFRKCFYHEPEEVAFLSEEQADHIRYELDAISVRGQNCPKPITKWSHCGLPVSCADVIKDLKYASPTPIQSQAIPAIMSGHDLVGIAKTGSGKTIAFLLPLFRHVKDQRSLRPGEGPIALILTPTRELALQIYRDAKPFLLATNLRGTCVYGGPPISEHIAEMKRLPEVVIATPGRMIDLLGANSGRVTNMSRVTYLVLDEADRMLDLGFEPQVMKIIENVRPDRQAVLFSATFPKQIEGLARKMLQHAPLEITIGGKSVVAPEITQVIEVRPQDTKFRRLLEILGQMYNNDQNARTLIFVERQDTADELMRDLLRRGYPTMSLHGGKDQVDRDTIISDFKAGVVPILTATSVAARGLDVKQLKLVVNYDVPSHLEDYVHRAGRTGRAGEHGTCITFITPEQDRYAKDIRAALKASNVAIPPELEELVIQHKANVARGMSQKSRSGFGGRGLSRLDTERKEVLRIQASAYNERTQSMTDLAARSNQVAGGNYDMEVEVQSGAVPEAVRENKVPHSYDFTDENQANMARIAAARAGGANTAQLREMISRINAEANARREGQQAALNEAMERARRARDPDATHFHAVVPINDFPQRARWNVTNKETMAMLIQSTGASITSKGAFYDRGKEPKPGEPPKLSLLIESNEQFRIEDAVREIKRLLLEGAQAAMELDRAPTGGRYTVV